jgi:hypothetical protein
MGIGAALLLGLLLNDALAVALGGFVVGGTLHALNHAIDDHLGGHAIDLWLLGAQVLLAAAALGLHLSSHSRLRRQQDSRESGTRSAGG